MKLIERIATQKKVKSEIQAPLPDHEPDSIAPENCSCEKPQPRWRSIDGQVFCAICTPIPSASMLDEFLHLPQSVPARLAAGFENEPDVIYEPLARAVPWSHGSIVRSIYESYGLLKPESESPSLRSPSNDDADQPAPLDPELAAWVLALTPADLPPEPWQFARWSQITSNALWLSALQSDVRLSGESPKAKTGALQKRLRELQAHLAKAD